MGSITFPPRQTVRLSLLPHSTADGLGSRSIFHRRSHANPCPSGPADPKLCSSFAMSQASPQKSACQRAQRGKPSCRVEIATSKRGRQCSEFCYTPRSGDDAFGAHADSPSQKLARVSSFHFPFLVATIGPSAASTPPDVAGLVQGWGGCYSQTLKAVSSSISISTTAQSLGTASRLGRSQRVAIEGPSTASDPFCE